jgi:undecaprenyl diphosphate synthase
MTATDIGKRQSTAWEEDPLLTQEELKNLDPKKIPKHIAIIPDGNRRWAKNNRILPEEGHKIGAETLLNIIKASHQIGVQTLTIYIFSTENWLRPKREIKAQMWLLEKSLIEQKERMIANGVRFQTIGELSKFPEHIIKLINETVEATKHCTNINVIFAMNYGGRDEITRAIRKIAEDCNKGNFSNRDITEELVSKYLDTAKWGDPDMLIRTSGESRVSNFLLWQISYAEIYLSEVFWPEFTPRHLLEAVYEYQNRERRLGGS